MAGRQTDGDKSLYVSSIVLSVDLSLQALELFLGHWINIGLYSCYLIIMI